MTAPSSKDIDDVEASFGRCLTSAGFFHRFYEIFFNSSPEIAKKFAHTDMERQERVVRQGVAHMISFARKDALAMMALERVAIVHSRGHQNIEPFLYGFWIESLLSAVREHDPACVAAVEQKWRAVMAIGLDFFTSRY